MYVTDVLDFYIHSVESFVGACDPSSKLKARQPPKHNLIRNEESSIRCLGGCNAFDGEQGSAPEANHDGSPYRQPKDDLGRLAAAPPSPSHKTPRRPSPAESPESGRPSTSPPQTAGPLLQLAYLRPPVRDFRSSPLSSLWRCSFPSCFFPLASRLASLRWLFSAVDAAYDAGRSLGHKLGLLISDN